MFKNKWVSSLKDHPEAKLRLFCFPYAGSGPSVFSKWPQYISNEIEIFAIKYPGRESRFNEEPYRRIADLIKDLAPEIYSFLSKPYMFFGHSLGAYICFYLARHLRRHSIPLPVAMFFSGAKAPHLPDKDYDVLHYRMDDKKFIEKLVEMGGMSSEILQNNELLNLVLPVLKADVEMLNTLEYEEEEPLDCCITALGGVYDRRACKNDTEAWKSHTCRDFRLAMVPGKHLFVNTHQGQVIDIINQEIKGYIRISQKA